MYKHILFATDFSPEAEIAEAKANLLAKQNGAKLSIIHVIDYYPSMQLDGGLAMEHRIDETLAINAEKNMLDCKKRLATDISHMQIARGAPKHAIAEYAEGIDADMIVLGSHGRHGLGLLLGSTANGVLHVAKCDVLAVRVV